MKPSVYMAAQSSDDISNGNLLQKTPKDNNILHVAAEHNQIRFFKELADQSPLFWAANKKGNTPLHIAATVGSIDVVIRLIQHANRMPASIQLLRKTNFQGETALHVAARSGHVDVVNSLIAEDPELCSLTNINQESPFFLATRQGHPRVAHSILNKCPASISLQGFNGVTALHVAVTSKYNDISIDVVRAMLAKDRHIVFKVDTLGWTALHYAAWRGNVEATRLLMQQDDNSFSYILDKSGMSALHVAAYAGHTNVMKELIQHRPDVCDLLNGKGQTALHSAVLGGQENVIMHSLKMPMLAALINEADEDGNTPLHLAAIEQNPEIISMLTHDPKVDINAINRKLSMASDIFLRHNIGAQEVFGLDNLGCPVGLPFFRVQIIRNFWNVQQNDGTEDTEDTLQRRESRLLIATLIATVTFAAAFAVPGGLKTDGMPVLAQDVSYKMFMGFNLLSFMISAFVIYNEIVDTRFLPVRVVAFLIRSCIVGMVVGLATGVIATQKTVHEHVHYIVLTIALTLAFLFLPTHLKRICVLI